MSLCEVTQPLPSKPRPRKYWNDLTFYAFSIYGIGSALSREDLVADMVQLTDHVWAGRSYDTEFLALSILDDNGGRTEIGFFTPAGFGRGHIDWHTWQILTMSDTRLGWTAIQIESCLDKLPFGIDVFDIALEVALNG